MTQPTPADSTLEGPSMRELDQVWERQVMWWHGLFAALMVTAAIVVAVGGQEPVGVKLALLGAMTAAYAIWGWRGLGQERPRYALAYLVVAWGAMAALAALDPGGASWIVLFALFPQTWASLPRNQAAAVVVVAVLAIGASQLIWGEGDDDDPTNVVITTAVMMVLSLSLGLFIDKLSEEANARARAIDALHETQAQLATVERAQGVAAERERLSREIHDTLAQGFTSVLTLARATQSAADRADLDTVRERLRLIESTAAENLAEARLIVAEMTPGHLQSRTLGQALQRLVDAVSQGSGMNGRFIIDGEPVALQANSEVVLLRSAQEALSNVRRHSRASSFEVRLRYAADGPAVLTVTDDGVGFAGAGEHNGYGLDGVTARAEEVGGRSDVDSAPGRGTRMTVEVPR